MCYYKFQACFEIKSGRYFFSFLKYINLNFQKAAIVEDVSLKGKIDIHMKLCKEKSLHIMRAICKIYFIISTILTIYRVLKLRNYSQQQRKRKLKNETSTLLNNFLGFVSKNISGNICTFML